MAYAFNDDKSKYDISDVVRTSDISDVVRTSDIKNVVRTSDISDVVRTSDIETTTKTDSSLFTPSEYCEAQLIQVRRCLDIVMFNFSLKAKKAIPVASNNQTTLGTLDESIAPWVTTYLPNFRADYITSAFISGVTRALTIGHTTSIPINTNLVISGTYIVKNLS